MKRALDLNAAGAYLELTKPRITALVVFTTAAGLWLAPSRPALRFVAPRGAAVEGTRCDTFPARSPLPHASPRWA